ncbi:GDSL-type esterase/lipase family protein [Eisenbergiella sp.]
MKNWKKCPLFLLLLVSGLVITGAGYAGEHSIYAAYSKPDGWMTPGLSLVFQGWKDGVYPWELFGGNDASQTMAEAETEMETETEGSVPEKTETLVNAPEAAQGQGTEETQAPQVSDNTAGRTEEGGQESVSQNSVSGNFLVGNGLVSGNSVQPMYDKFGKLINQPGSEQAKQEIPMQLPDGAGVSENQVPAEGGEASRAEGQGNTSENGEQSREQPAEGQEQQEASEEDPNKTYEFTTVSEDYFNDALFIGDSRTVGLCEYAGMRDRATFYAATSLTIYNVFESPKKVAQLDDGTKVTIEEALSQKQFKKIYIMLGINELGRGTTESFFTVYANTVNRIRQLQPDAIIFIQGIMRVSGEKSRTDKVFNNATINERNEALAAMANNQDIFYLEINDAVCDANGDLVTEYTFDQIHLKAKYYQLWKNYLLGHGIVREE